jgi:hypothetical protein
MAEQNFKNHTRLDPGFHFFLMPLALIGLIASITHIVQGHRSPADALLVLVTFTLLIASFTIRVYSLKVQNRVIRLEEQTRMRWLGVDSTGLTIGQFVALRFASDNEVGALAARAKAEGLTNKQIKEAIVNWRPDHDRV